MLEVSKHNIRGNVLLYTMQAHRARAEFCSYKNRRRVPEQYRRWGWSVAVESRRSISLSLLRKIMTGTCTEVSRLWPLGEIAWKGAVGWKGAWHKKNIISGKSCYGREVTRGPEKHAGYREKCRLTGATWFVGMFGNMRAGGQQNQRLCVGFNFSSSRLPLPPLGVTKRLQQPLRGEF